MTTTPKLGIPLISSQQSQPEITHNTMVVLVTALAGGALGQQNAPPGSPADGDCYIVGTAPTGAWAGHANAITVFYGGWQFVPGYDDDGVIIPLTAAQNGLSIFNNGTRELWAWLNTTWVAVIATEADVGFMVSGFPNTGGIINYPINQPLSLPAGLTGSKFAIGTNPTATAVFALSHVVAGVPTAIGSLSIASTGVVTVTFAAPVSFVAGDWFRVVAPNPQDATLADIGLNFKFSKG